MFVFLFRVLLFFVTVSVIRSVVQVVLRALRGTGVLRNPPASAASTSSGNAGPAGEASASTLLHQDPVCGTYVAAGSSLRKICNGKVFHFCSEECRNRYSG